MANKKYVCPICGKIWYTPNDVAACATKDAAEETKKKSEERKIEACRQSDYTNLMSVKTALLKSIISFVRKFTVSTARHRSTLVSTDSL